MNHPTDREAGAGASQGKRSNNLEEAKSAARASVPVASATYCTTCAGPAIPDPRKTHECARCRSTLIPAFAEKREKERAARRAEIAAKSAAFNSL